LLAPKVDFSSLAEIEKDLALVMQPRSKLDRLVFTERLVEAGLSLLSEAQEVAKNGGSRAVLVCLPPNGKWIKESDHEKDQGAARRFG
jgi:hypothetical protein